MAPPTSTVSKTPLLFSAPSLNLPKTPYKSVLSWAPTLLAILEGAQVGIWNGHDALKVVREKMGPVVESEDKLTAARQKWMLGPMLSDARSSGPFGGTSHDLSKWTKHEKALGHLGPVRAKRMATGQMYTSSDDELTEDDTPSTKRPRRAMGRGRGGRGRARAKKRVRPYC